MKIGLVGEAPNDTNSIQNLLIRKYPDFEYFPLLDRINGSQLDSQKTKRFLRTEFEDRKPDIVIFIRDLDSTLPNKEKVIERKQYFSDSNSVVNKKGIYLLHMFEIEVFILANVDVFNSIYGCKVPYTKDPMIIPEPKEYLKEYAKDYCESDNPDIFKQIDFEIVKRCSYFDIFIKKFEKPIAH